MNSKEPKDSSRSNARRRALRAAQVVTLGLALTGCYSAHQAAHEVALTDDAGAMVDWQDGSAPVALDTGLAQPDAGAVADAGANCTADAGWEDYSACCDAQGWAAEWGCLAWGPYVPPAEGALPAPRRQVLDSAAVGLG